MADYITNGPVSVPLHVQGVTPDVDLNGVKFSYDIGMFYTPATTILPVKLPPLFSAGPQ
jgi:hypothetical protein